MTLDQDVVNLAKSIRQVETGNTPVAGKSGELPSRYQFMPGTWKSEAGRILGDPNAPLTPENENKVAYTRIKEWKDKGYGPDQIASMWNSGSPSWKGKVGVNEAGVPYDVPAYVSKVKSAYQGMKQKSAPAQAPQAPAPEPPQAPQGATGLAGLGVGALKGLGSTLAGASALGENLLQAPLKAFGVPVSTPLGTQIRESGTLTPTTTSQKLGYGAEQLGELFLPGAGPSKAAKALEAAAGLEKGAEAASAGQKAVEALKALGRAGTRGAVEGAVLGGQTALQQGGITPDVKTTAALGFAAPFAGAALRPVGEAIGKAVGPESLMGKALGFTKSQIKKLDSIATEGEAYKGINDFALRNGFQGSRQQMADQIGDRFNELTKGTKPEILANITTPIKNTYKSAFGYLQKAYDVPGQEAALEDINAMAKKPKLSAVELDKVRTYIDRSLPTGAYKGAEPVKVQGLQNLVDPMRRTLEKLDKSGTIRRTNQDIRILYKMLDAMESAKSGNVGAQALWRTMQRIIVGGGAGAAGVPSPVTAPFVLWGLATDFPEVSSFIAQRLRGVQSEIPKSAPPVIKTLLKRVFG